MSPIKKILKYFFHHSFSGEMVDRVHQRLAEPGDEREKEEVLREIWNEIGFPEADKRSEMAFTRLENTLDVRPRPCLRIPAWVRIAAIWLIPLLSLGVSYYLYRDARDVRQLAFMERFVPSGKRERITLPDGSEVWLNSGTLLLYPSDFIGDKREIYLVGEGYFKVRKRPEQPFIVRTKAMRVQVLGTEFNLSAYSDQEKITTTLEEGSLKILPDDPSVAPCILSPNEQLVYIPSRGKVDVFVTMDAVEADQTVVQVNEPLARSYYEALTRLQKMFVLSNDLSPVALAKFPDVLTVTKVEEDLEMISADICAVLEEALAAHRQMRSVEGEKLCQDIAGRADTIEIVVGKVEERSPQTVAEYRDRLETKMREVLQSTAIDESRILTEAAIFADKIAVDEETVRLRSHLAQLRTMLSGDEPVGRKLDFLIQEVNRECNTIGSKCNDLTIARDVVNMKAEVEKIREQVQNIE